MALDALVQWIQVADLETVDPLQVRGLVREAREGLSEEDPRALLLEHIEAELWEGSLPVQALQELAGAWTERPQERSACVILEEEIRLEAARLADREWRTSFFVQALEAVACLQQEDFEAFASRVDAMRERILEAWESYAQTPLLAEEVTAETTAGHRVLREGLEGWLVALERLEAAARGEADLGEALVLAEACNRLLVAVQNQSRRLLASAS